MTNWNQDVSELGEKGNGRLPAVVIRVNTASAGDRMVMDG